MYAIKYDFSIKTLKSHLTQQWGGIRRIPPQLLTKNLIYFHIIVWCITCYVIFHNRIHIILYTVLFCDLLTFTPFLPAPQRLSQLVKRLLKLAQVLIKLLVLICKAPHFTFIAFAHITAPTYLLSLDLLYEGKTKRFLISIV